VADTWRRARPCAELDVPWARAAPARGLRALILHGILGPLMDLYTRRRIVGARRVAEVDGPVVFVANHSSHMDTPALLRALPKPRRGRTVVAAAADYFYRSRPVAWGVSLIFNTVPMQRYGGGLGPDSSRHLDRLIARGWSLLVFAEGTRSRDGSVGRLRTGGAVLAAEHGLPIVPIHIAGTHQAMPPGRRWMRRRGGRLLPRRHPVEIRFGAPIHPREDEHRAEVMERVRQFFAESGAVTTPPAPREPAVSTRPLTAAAPPAPVAAPVARAPVAAASVAEPVAAGPMAAGPVAASAPASTGARASRFVRR
jgi:1-acyl-sn-glycerol-3-phosphate acyltransferase